MTSSAFALAALLSLPWVSHPSQAHRAHHRIGPWTLTVVQDRFSGQVQCRLAARGMDFERGALTLHLSPKADTSDAVYRIDGGLPHSVRADTLELVRMGFAVHRDDLTNPSGGLVRIPVAALAGATQVAVVARPGAPIYSFQVGALAPALDAARTAGCTPESFR